VFDVIVVASTINKELVVKKAEASRRCHRSTSMCDQLLAEVQGFEILDS
jgi:hypothetical protein